MEKGKVSVIIPTYNLSDILISRSVSSILNQTYHNLECLVIDDGSTDNTETKVRELIKKDSRLKYFKLKNGGQASAKNFGVKQAQGEFIAFNDHDDEYLPNYLEVALRVFRENPSVSYLSSGAINRDENNNETYYLPELEPFWKLSIGNGWVFRAQAFFDKNMNLNPDISGFEDLELHIKFHKSYQGYVINQPLRIYYLRSRPSSSVLNLKEYHNRFTRSFGAFFSGHKEDYKKYGQEAYAWICFFGGLIYMRAGEVSHGRQLLSDSFRAKKTLSAFLYLFSSYFGRNGFSVFDASKGRVMRLVRIYFLNKLP